MRSYAYLAGLAVVVSCSSGGASPTSETAAGSAGTPATATAGAVSSGGASPGLGGGGMGVVAGNPGASAASATGGTGATDSAGAPTMGGAGVSGSSGANVGSGAHAGSGASGGSGFSGASGASTQGASGGSAGGSSSAPGVRVVGRTALGANSAVRFSWPGVSFHARFTGTQVSMNLNDGSNRNRFTVVVDGGTPKTITTSGQATLSLASGLQSGPHELVIWRNTEPGMGASEFLGLSSFGTGGALLAPPAAPDRRIEVIGDSLSAGAGVEGTSTSCAPSIDAFTNNYLAYGSVAARAVEADVVTVAWSGIGVYRSYSAQDPTMPQRYDYAIPNDQTAWDFSKYQPQVVVLNLGTNDFGAGNPGQPYIQAYVNFVEHVHSKYASARFVLIDMYGGERLTALNSVVSALKSAGVSDVQTLSFSSVPNNNTACNQHPNTAAQAAMGALLATRLKSLLGW